jgi:hypothetical protein
MFKIEIQSDHAKQVLNRLASAGENLEPLMGELAAILHD